MMDYQTKPISRSDLRRMSKYFRKLYGVKMGGPFPVLRALERLSDVFTGSNYLVVEDSCMPNSTMARCMANDSGGYTVEIKESVYDGAYHGIGADLGFICHELCHVFLFTIGFTPIVTRSFSSGELQAYRSVEWQAKALCGEVMIPYSESIGMNAHQIVEKYHVSWASAEYRINQS